MERKIFRKSDEFTKPVFDVRQKILITGLDGVSIPSSWWLRSVCNEFTGIYTNCLVAFVNFYAGVNSLYPHLAYGIVPVCTI